MTSISLSSSGFNDALINHMAQLNIHSIVKSAKIRSTEDANALLHRPIALQQLEELTVYANLDYDAVESIIARSPQLQTLKFFNSRLTANEIAHLISKTDGLISLQLYGCKNVADSFSPELFSSSLNSIETLVLSNSTISVEFLLVLASKTRKLKSLHLDGCKNLAGTFDPAQLPSTLDSVEAVDVSSSTISLDLLLTFLLTMPHLKSLNLSGCQNILGPLDPELLPASLDSIESLDAKSSKISLQFLLAFLLKAKNMKSLHLDEDENLAGSFNRELLPSTIDSIRLKEAIESVKTGSCNLILVQQQMNRTYTPRELLPALVNGVSPCPHIVQPLPEPLVQYGPTCKLYALSMALNRLYTMKKMANKPLPARKRDRTIVNKSSLRQRNRELFGSMVGEVYNHKHLVILAKEQGCDVKIIRTTKENYIQELKNQIDNNHTPLVFFDIDTKAGRPVLKNSKSEHAAVATGHFADVHGEQFFTLCHWNQDWIVSATALMESANNLSENRPGEIFHRIGKKWRQVGDRRDSQTNDLKTIISQGASLRMKITTGSDDKDGHFRNTILVLT